MNLFDLYLEKRKYSINYSFKDLEIEILNLKKQQNLKNFSIENPQEAFNQIKIFLQNFISSNANNPSYEDNIKFILCFFYLEHSNYYIPQLNDFSKNFYYDFNSCIFRVSNHIRDFHVKDNSYAKRREFINSLNIEKIQDEIVGSENYFNFLDNTFILNRNQKFKDLGKKEKLLTLCNCIEYLLKKNDKFLNLNEDIFFGFINKEIPKKFRKDNWFIRHSSEEALKLREDINEQKLDFLINLGITMTERLWIFLKFKNK